MTDIELTIEGLKKHFGGVRAVDGLSFAIRGNELIGLIGPNGSGKTTLMKTISRIETPQNGRIKILERPIQSYTRKHLAKTISWVPQTIPIDFPFTVMEVILMGRAPHQGILGIENQHDFKIVKDAMKFVGVEHLAERKMDQLSGGERQRVYIAKALCQEPKILLLDEPTASLDLAHQVRIMDLMERLKTEKGVTIVMVSHDVNLAALYADHLLLLKDGKIVKTGSSDQVLTCRTLEDTYGCKLLIDKNPLGELPRIGLVPDKFKVNEKKDVKLF